MFDLRYEPKAAAAGQCYGLSSMQGKRELMEDSHLTIINITENVSWFAIFDGHGSGGAFVSCHFSKKLLDSICSSDLNDTLRKDHTLGEEELIEKVKTEILNWFLEMDKSLQKLPEFAKSGGTTAVCALITEKYILLINCGDSRGVLSQGAKPVLATEDHKPSNPQEKERIESAGGSVEKNRLKHPLGRSLGVSRGLGDYMYKNVPGKGPTEQMVSPVPQFYFKVRKPEDEFLVLACDGVWDVMTNEDICSFIAARMRITQDLEQISNEVLDTCLQMV